MQKDNYRELRHNVVQNLEEQMSVWPENMKLPDGWYVVGVAMKYQECLDYIETQWLDIRPLSQRSGIGG
ncbi:MbtH family NRPS accessory protein [Endozoicomonas sp. G2_1]|uniref:MbtH family NRPS accessory protein n=1 Tax=Endozoicomonas sp. G2_1 TaxID=2821091 RepID=UPI001ADA96CF|nr:MbtH family NRPS accessory protein [Endozoicomonas sp. G2_1]MBO9489822.1 MbtH family NRPS accessory protein [Endozoicomonas sp. G2_1]